ncbi:MAG: TauD/TfdA family dioxygenase [Bryobacteraceae bacterium]
MQVSPTLVHSRPIEGPTAWVQRDFQNPAVWDYHLTPETIGELDRAITAIRAGGKQLGSLTAADFDLPSFREPAETLRAELGAGRGFVVVKGLPIARYTEDEAAMAYWGLGAFLGRPLPQNVQGERLYAVRDEGYQIARDWGTVGVRFSKTTEGLNFHTDSAPALMGNTPDVVGLLALQVAKSGGASALVSATSVHNVMLAERPDLLARLYQPYHFDRRAELRTGESSTLVAPVFRYADSLQVRYFRFYIPQGHEIAGAPLTDADVAPLDFLDKVMNRSELQVTFEMQPGDMQFVSNTFVLHSRTRFEDHAGPERRRHLKRLWLQF